MAHTRPRSLLLALAGVLLALTPPGASGGPPSALERLEGAEAAVLDRWADLAQACASARLDAERDALAEAVLRRAPDHAKARALLGWRRGRTGAWERAPSWTPGRNAADAKALAQIEARRARIDEEHAAAVLAVLGDSAAALPLAEREQALSRLVEDAPTAAAARQANDERLVGGRWLLRETVEGRARRPALAEAARRALAAVPEPRAVALDEDDRLHAPEASCAFEAPPLRGVGARGPEEVLKALRATAASPALVSAALGDAAPSLAGFTAMFSASREAALRAVAAAPEWTDEDRQAARRLDCLWAADARRLLVLTESAPVRVEWPVRQAVAQQLRDAYGVRMEHGALHEGLGVYLTSALTGTRTTWFTQGGRRAQGGARPPDGKAGLAHEGDWLGRARALARRRAPDTGRLLGLPVDGMTGEDQLLAYALAAYLLEGRPADAARTVRDLVAQPAEDALPDALGMTPRGLDMRLGRWLEETAPEPASEPGRR